MTLPAAHLQKSNGSAFVSSRRHLVPGVASLAIALALGATSVLAQQSGASTKNSGESDDFDATLEAFTSPDPALSPSTATTPPHSSLFPLPPGSPFGGYPWRNSLLGAPLINAYLPNPGFGPFANGYPVAALGPQGTPIAGPTPYGPSGSINANAAFGGPSSFDVLKQPSEFKYTGSEIGLLYGFSSSGASIRSAGFITSMASNTTQIYVGATFTDQSGLPFNPFSTANRKPKYSAQTQQYFGGLNYKIAGGAMLVGIEFAVDNTKLSGNFKPFNRNQPLTSVINPNNIGNGNTYGGQINLSGGGPGNTAFQVGLSADGGNGFGWRH